MWSSLDEKLEVEAQQYILESKRVKNEAQALMCKTDHEQNTACKPKVKVKVYEPHNFEGNLKSHPTLKDDFQRLVKSVYGPDPYALKMWVGGDTLQTVRGAKGNSEEIFERLDDKNENARKIVDLVT